MLVCNFQTNISSCSGFDNPMYSSQLSQASETSVAVFTPTPTPGAVLATVPESHDPSSSPPDYYQLYNGQKPPSSSEEKEQLSTSPEIEKQPHPSAKAAEQNGLPPQVHHSGDNSNNLEHASSEADGQPHLPAETLEHNGLPPQSQINADHGTAETMQEDKTTNNTVTNGAAGAGAVTLTAVNTVDESRERISSKTKKKGIMKGLFGSKDKSIVRRSSQKPLLNSQSSVTTTPGDRYEY